MESPSCFLPRVGIAIKQYPTADHRYLTTKSSVCNVEASSSVFYRALSPRSKKPDVERELTIPYTIRICGLVLISFLSQAVLSRLSSVP